MGCLNSKQPARIVAMETRNRDQIFTSTSDIYKIYHFGRIIGAGSFGKVRLGHLRSNPQKTFAIKIIDKKAVYGNESLLANEIFLLKQLDHPNIIKFYEVYQSDIYFYICTEYCKGGELLERVAKQRQMISEQTIKQIMYKIISAIVYIHEMGIAHRDIKPENIMFADTDLHSDPKLIDFGLANKFDTSHFKKLKTYVGTPLYMPPEIIDGSYDEKCDVWSLGVLLYVLLCGKPPFFGLTQEALESKIKGQSLVFETKIWHRYSPDVIDLLKLMLTKNPKARLSSKQCLNHAWFKKMHHQRSQSNFGKDSESDDRTIFEMLRNFRNGAKFQKEVVKVLLNQLDENEMKNLREKFQKIDVDNSGTITVGELKKALYDEGCTATQGEIEDLIQTVVIDEGEDDQKNKRLHEITIKYTDFMAACIDARKFFTKDKLWSIFKYFDVDDNNFITKANLMEAFARNGRQLDDEKIDQMIAEIDPNHDNKISFDEFCEMMYKQGVVQTLNFRESVTEQ